MGCTFIIMATNSSAKKRIRQNIKKKLSNKYYYKSTKTEIKNIMISIYKDISFDTEKAINEINSLIDKLKKKHVIHGNKSNNWKSKLVKSINTIKTKIN